MSRIKFYHLIGRCCATGKNFGLTFAYMTDDDGTIRYSVSRCSENEGNFTKRRGREIAQGRLEVGAGNSDLAHTLPPDEYNCGVSLLHNVVSHYRSVEWSALFNNLLDQWLEDMEEEVVSERQ